MTPPQPLRVVGYVRVSDPRQVEGFSLDAQRHAITEECRRRGHNLVHIYVDAGISAYRDRLRYRPAFQQAIDAVVNGEADALAVDKLDRLSRRARTFHDVMDRLGNRVIFVKESIDPTTPTGELVAGILAQAAQFFSRNLGVETIKGKQQRVRDGLWLGSLPYGYRKRPGDAKGRQGALIDDAPLFCHIADRAAWSRADVVRHVFALAEAGETRRGIYRAFSRLGIELGGGLINTMLVNRFYVGDVRSGDAWTPGTQPPLITREQFDAVRARQQENRIGAGVVRRAARVHALTGLVLCGRCGSVMHCQPERGGQVRLLCSGRHDRGRCDQISVQARYIEEGMLSALAAYSLPPDIARRTAEAVTGSARDIETERAAISEGRARLREVFLAGDLSREEYRVRRQELDRRESSLVEESSDEDALEDMVALLTDLPAAYRLAGDERLRNGLVAAVLTGIMVDNQEVIAVRPKPSIDRMLRRATVDVEAARISACSRTTRPGRPSG